KRVKPFLGPDEKTLLYGPFRAFNDQSKKRRRAILCLSSPKVAGAERSGMTAKRNTTKSL
ncbi:hypothetical protein, partial [Candidatus Avelusimicrobium stercoris]|uniref:hypothetical protein n=1 Tax=Candidatus Avelusimicrobium stercoris TaxID=1947924 RepID=UPI003D0B9734